jgi:hypothetical protein
MLWMGIWVPPHTVMPLWIWGGFQETWGMVELDWHCKVMAEAPNPCIWHPPSLSYLITRHFSILLCSGWAYGSNLTLFHFCAGGGGILKNLGYGRALVMLNSHGWGSKPIQIASHIQIVSYVMYKSKWFSTLLCCGWAGPPLHCTTFVLVHVGVDITELVVWSSYVERSWLRLPMHPTSI